MATQKCDVVNANDPEPIRIGDVEFDATDADHPINIVEDGWCSLADAKQLHADLGKAIELAEKATNP